MAVIVLNAAPQGHAEASVLGPKGNASYSAVAALNCTRYTGLIPADAMIERWCIRIYRGT